MACIVENAVILYRADGIREASYKGPPKSSWTMELKDKFIFVENYLKSMQFFILYIFHEHFEVLSYNHTKNSDLWVQIPILIVLDKFIFLWFNFLLCKIR